jgi:hypothetical protein
MDATENVIRNVGWLNKCPDGIVEVNTTPIDIDINQTNTQWKSIVKNRRQEVVTE